MDFKKNNWAEEMINDLLGDLKKGNNISEEDWKSKISDKENEVIEIFIETFSQTFPTFIKEKKIKEVHEGLANFEAELKKDYITAFESLDTFSFLFNHFGVEYFNSEKDEHKLRNYIIRRLFFRGIQINNEIFYLLKGGFTSGALARWRSLHEVVIVFILLKNGNDELVEMYRDYEAVEKCKRAKALLKHHETIKWPSPDELVKELESKVDQLKLKYGKDFVREYGWTMNVLPKGKRSISGIEEFVNLNYLRTFYSYASDDIHAGIGSLQKDQEISFEKYVSNWGGRSMFGFIDPVQLTISTLYSLIYSLTSDKETLGNYIYVGMIRKQCDQVIEEFVKAEQALKEWLNRSEKKEN